MTSQLEGTVTDTTETTTGTPDLEVSQRGRDDQRVVTVRRGDDVLQDQFNTALASRRDRFVASVVSRGLIDGEASRELDQRILREADAADAQQRRETRSQGQLTDGPPDVEDPSPDVQSAAEAFLQNDDIVGELRRDLQGIGIVGEDQLAITLYLVCTSRLLEEPCAACVQAASSSGKSFVANHVLDLFPPEELIRATDITPNALYYSPEDELCHKIVFVAERRHSNSESASEANASLALREMLSSGRLDKFVTVGREAVHITQEGPIAYVETTTQTEIFEEDASRMLPLTTDESPEQTQRILDAQGRAAREPSTTRAEQRELIIEKHRTAQRMLEQLRVVVPYAGLLRLPNVVKARRAFGLVMSIIRSMALLRQRQKRADGGVITADLEDYRIAYEVLRPVLRRIFAPLCERAAGLLALIRANSEGPGTEFTRPDCVQWAGVSLTEVRNRLRTLEDRGYVEVVEGGRGRTYRYQLTERDAVESGVGLLISPTELGLHLGEHAEEPGSTGVDESDRITAAGEPAEQVPS